MSKYLVTGFLQETVETTYQRVITASSRSAALGLAEEGDFNEWIKVDVEHLDDADLVVGANPIKLTNANAKEIEEEVDDE